MLSYRAVRDVMKYNGEDAACPCSTIISNHDNGRGVLFAEAGARTFTRSTTKDAYACNPSASQPMAGNSLKNRLVAAASRDVDAFSNCVRKMSRSSSRAVCNACAGGSGLSAVGWDSAYENLRLHEYVNALTTAVSANGPEVTSNGRAIALAQ